MGDFKTIGEVSTQLNLPQHVLRFWESQFPQIKPIKRRGGRRFYDDKDIEILERIRGLLYVNSYTIKGAKKALNQNFIPSGDFEMRKRKEEIDPRQVNIFEMIEPQTAKSALQKTEKQEAPGLKQLLENLKEIQKLLSQRAS